jgi:hypothetical protein
MLKVRTVAVTTVGANGVAVGSGSISLAAFGGEAKVLGIYLDYAGTAPATTDVTITDGAGTPVLTRTDTATDGAFYPARQGHDAAGTAIANVYLVGLPVRSDLTVAVAQCNALDPAVTATFYLEV